MSFLLAFWGQIGIFDPLPDWYVEAGIFFAYPTLVEVHRHFIRVGNNQSHRWVAWIEQVSVSPLAITGYV